MTVPEYIVAVDYDGTFTWNASAMTGLCNYLKSFGVQVVCVTSRDGTQRDQDEMRKVLPLWMEIIFCGEEYKGDVLRRLGIEAIFVMDDQPEAWGRSMPMWRVKLIGLWKWLLSKVQNGK
jgi:hypothetical protein